LHLVVCTYKNNLGPSWSQSPLRKLLHETGESRSSAHMSMKCELSSFKPKTQVACSSIIKHMGSNPRSLQSEQAQPQEPINQ
jgi:hypothetical protein